MRSKAKKIPNLLYVATSWLRMLAPRTLRRRQRTLLLRGWQQRTDAEEIRRRVAYYCQTPLSAGEGRVEARKIWPGRYNSAYVYDIQGFLRAWPARTQLNFFSGDTLENPREATLIKTRRLDSLSPLATIMNMDRRRHFLKVADAIPFDEKIDLLFFRGAVKGKPRRIRMMEMWADADFTDFGDTATDWRSPWSAPPVTITDHFRYRFILCLEGNDVCSALQWVMASGCVPVMPRPTVEGWLMHGLLEPGRHYIEIAPDFSDLGDKMRYYRSHPEEARLISEESRKWAERFGDPRRERIISHLVLARYFGSEIQY